MSIKWRHYCKISMMVSGFSIIRALILVCLFMQIRMQQAAMDVPLYVKGSNGAFELVDSRYSDGYRSKRSAKNMDIFDDTNKNLEDGPFSIKNLGIDILIVVDNTVYEHFLDSVRGDEYAAEHAIHQYYSSILFELSRIYTSQRLGNMRFKIYPVGIVITKIASESPWAKLPTNTTKTLYARTMVDAFEALRAFRKWVQSEVENLPRHDHAMSFTRMDITRYGDSKAQGIAYVKSICRTAESVSLVEDVGAMATVAIAGHELAHSLGAEHDGKENASVCLPHHNYIMVPSVSASRDTLPNTFTFSECTVQQIRAHVIGHPALTSCLYHSDLAKVGYQSIDTVAANPHPGPGLMIDVNQQCQRAFGLTFRYCGDNDYYLKQLCRQLWCKDLSQPRESRHCYTKPYLPALSGTSCGHKMLCRNGDCIQDERAAPAKEDCQFGDRDQIFCMKLIATSASRCKVATYQRMCCQTCRDMQARRKRRRLRHHRRARL